MENKEIYIILEYWKRKTGDEDIKITVFSNYEKMKKCYKNLKNIYLIDFSDNKNLIFEEKIDDKKEQIFYSAYDENSIDNFEINCFKKEVFF